MVGTQECLGKTRATSGFSTQASAPVDNARFQVSFPGPQPLGSPSSTHVSNPSCAGAEIPELGLVSGWELRGWVPRKWQHYLCAGLWVRWGGVCTLSRLCSSLPFVCLGPLGLTCMGLHVLQQVAVELELDTAGTACVGFWGRQVTCDRWLIPRHPDTGLQAALKVGDPDTYLGPRAQPIHWPVTSLERETLWGGRNTEKGRQAETGCSSKCLLHARHCSERTGKDNIQAPGALRKHTVPLTGHSSAPCPWHHTRATAMDRRSEQMHE